MEQKQLLSTLDHIEQTIFLPNYVLALFSLVKNRTCFTKAINDVLSQYNIYGSMAKIDFIAIVFDYM